MKLLFVALLLAATSSAQTTAAQAPTKDTSFVDADGTARITRVIPVPPDLSPEAKKLLSRPDSDANTPEPLAQRRSRTDEWQEGAGKKSQQIYPVNIEKTTIAGVPVRVFTPIHPTTSNADRVLINLHGGGFNSDSGSLTESIPLANLAKVKVVAVLYRLAPEHPYPAALDDAIAVYKDLLKTYKPEHIAIYGTSAGAILTAEVAVKLKQLSLPMPGALGIFSGMGDLDRMGDSMAMYALRGLSGHLDPPTGQHDKDYLAATSPRDPVVSPVYADLHGMPPSLFITSGRDLLLSGTTILHRAYLRAGNDAQLIVFEGLPHAFWNQTGLPETEECYDYMSKFFIAKLGLK
ncbi:Alpha/beta hydrolase [Candidatus Koribacter versatilis Ellin345]|uniref:Alpha/beta hydrolase n=1 Tax=Koribacter versatilis (strain Ellin345) TaxID=204669 RepID=Q1IUF6_KORVE|nr:alpha/beta hydrolase fold domain-containing protein [Candidatus Koribacter versatilis]ABF39494.1 Alpha/beta hydrolase [Candidatus Koribacter versatilis Ellin345]